MNKLGTVIMDFFKCQLLNSMSEKLTFGHDGRLVRVPETENRIPSPFHFPFYFVKADNPPAILRLLIVYVHER